MNCLCEAWVNKIGELIKCRFHRTHRSSASAQVLLHFPEKEQTWVTRARPVSVVPVVTLRGFPSASLSLSSRLVSKPMSLGTAVSKPKIRDKISCLPHPCSLITLISSSSSSSIFNLVVLKAEQECVLCFGLGVMVVLLWFGGLRGTEGEMISKIKI